jgi:CheY-like chemotaxis protein
MLEKLGCETSALDLPFDALEQIHHHDFDIILFAFEASDFRSIDVIRAIRGSDLLRQPAIIGLVSEVTPEVRQLGLDSGMDELVSNPPSLDALKRALEAPRSPAGPGSRPPPPESIPSYDPKSLARLAESFGPGEEEAALDLTEAFLADLPTRIAAILVPLEAGDLPAVTRAAHQLKGTAGTFGAMRLASRVRQIETLAKGGALEDARVIAQAVKAEAEPTCSAIRAGINDFRTRADAPGTGSLGG